MLCSCDSSVGFSAFSLLSVDCAKLYRFEQHRLKLKRTSGFVVVHRVGCLNPRFFVFSFYLFFFFFFRFFFLLFYYYIFLFSFYYFSLTKSRLLSGVVRRVDFLDLGFLLHFSSTSIKITSIFPTFLFSTFPSYQVTEGERKRKDHSLIPFFFSFYFVGIFFSFFLFIFFFGIIFV